MGVNTNNMPVLRNTEESSEITFEDYCVDWSTAHAHVCLTKTGATLTWFENRKAKTAFLAKKSLPRLAQLTARDMLNLLDNGRLMVVKSTSQGKELLTFHLRDIAVDDILGE